MHGYKKKHKHKNYFIHIKIHKETTNQVGRTFFFAIFYWFNKQDRLVKQVNIQNNITTQIFITTLYKNNNINITKKRHEYEHEYWQKDNNDNIHEKWEHNIIGNTMKLTKRKYTSWPNLDTITLVKEKWDTC